MNLKCVIAKRVIPNFKKTVNDDHSEGAQWFEAFFAPVLTFGSAAGAIFFLVQAIRAMLGHLNESPTGLFAGMILFIAMNLYYTHGNNVYVEEFCCHDGQPSS